MARPYTVRTLVTRQATVEISYDTSDSTYGWSCYACEPDHYPSGDKPYGADGYHSAEEATRWGNDHIDDYHPEQP